MAAKSASMVTRTVWVSSLSAANGVTEPGQTPSFCARSSGLANERRLLPRRS